MKSRSIQTVAFVLITASAAHADSISLNSLTLYDGGAAPVVTITGGVASGQTTYANPQVSGTGDPGPILYCVDLLHTNYLGSSYGLNVAPTGITFANPGADNQIGYFLAQDQSTVDARGAVQLAIWSAIDSGFTFSTSDTTLVTDYNNLEAGFAANYDPSTTYNATFFTADRPTGSPLYQDMVDGDPTATPADFPGAVPEPSSLILATIGLSGLVGVYLWRRLG